MRHIIALLFLPFIMGASTLSGIGTGPGTCTLTATTGTESAPTASTEGCSLSGVGAFVVIAESETNMTAGSLLAYVYSSTESKWVPVADLNLSVAGGGTEEAWPKFEVLVPMDRLAFVPSGVGVAVSVSKLCLCGIQADDSTYGWFDTNGASCFGL